MFLQTKVEMTSLIRCDFLNVFKRSLISSSLNTPILNIGPTYKKRIIFLGFSGGCFIFIILLVRLVDAFITK